ncbi:MAG: PAS domain S-box protein [Burkholderiales bacterium]|nr:PAS domain S-box protein [Burkholderiales bacterium]
MSTPGRPSRPASGASIVALLSGVLLAALVMAAVALVAWYQRREIEDNAVERAALLARVLDDQAARSVDTVAVALHALADDLSRRADLTDAARVRPLLQQALVGLPHVRSFAVLDTQGRVLIATSAADAGHRVDLLRIAPAAVPGSVALGSFVAGRGLADVPAPAAAAPPQPADARGPGFIPLRLGATLADATPVWLVAVLNPDSFATYQQLATGDSGRLAVLATYDGQVLAATADTPAPGSSLKAHPVWAQHLPRNEHGSYVGRGLAGDAPQIVAFRAARTQPLVALVEEPLDAVVQRWWQSVRWFLAAAGVAAVLLLAMGVAAWRSLRAREAARRERDAAQAQVVQNERQLRVLVKSLQELIFRTDARGRLSFVNARWRAATGRSADDILGRELAELVSPADVDAVRRLFAAPTATGMRTVRASLPSVDGPPRVVDFALTALRSGGQVIGYAGSAVDVTERHAAEQQLQAQLAFSALLLEISPLPTALSDAQGRLISVNRAWQAFLGHRDAQLAAPAGMPLDSGAPGLPQQPLEEQIRHRQHDHRLLAPTVPGVDADHELRYESRILHADGSLRDVVVTKVRVPGEAGQARGILCALMDVSEFREAERATRDARDAAEEASRSKSEFVANISHELRTPLQSILGFSELGLVRGADSPKLAAMFRDIHASGERMLALVNDLLDVAKIESTVGTFHLERTDLRGLVRAVVRELDPLLTRKRLRMDETVSDAPLVVKVDPLRFQQVMRNILANAIKFSPPERAIELLGEATPDGQIHWRVRDHGPGIPPAEVDQIFEAFVQSSTTKDGSGGTGLGLAICRKIVEAHGGRITAANAPGGGAVFDLWLPARGYAETAPMALG